jgi:hypothetical protein
MSIPDCPGLSPAPANIGLKMKKNQLAREWNANSLHRDLSTGAKEFQGRNIR